MYGVNERMTDIERLEQF